MKQKTIFLISLFIIISLMLMPSEALKSALDALNIWLFSLCPSIFPFMVSSKMLVLSGGASLIGKVFQYPIKKIFSVSKESSFAMFTGLMCGYPMGAKSAFDLYQNRLITPDEAKIILSCSLNASPSFILSAVALNMLNNEISGYIILFSSLISNIITGIIVSGIYIKSSTYMPIFACENKFDTPPSQIISKSISDSLTAILQLGGYIIFFAAFTSILSEIGFFKILAAFMPFPDDISSAILKGFFEMTTGVKEISILNYALELKTALSAFILSFGGICVHFQCYEFYKSIPDISFYNVFIFKIINAILSGFISYFLCMFLL